MLRVALLPAPRAGGTRRTAGNDVALFPEPLAGAVGALGDPVADDAAVVAGGERGGGSRIMLVEAFFSR